MSVNTSLPAPVAPQGLTIIVLWVRSAATLTETHKARIAYILESSLYTSCSVALAPISCHLFSWLPCVIFSFFVFSEPLKEQPVLKCRQLRRENCLKKGF